VSDFTSVIAAGIVISPTTGGGVFLE